MDNENNMNGENGTTYHYGPNESPFSREDVSGSVQPQETFRYTEANNASQQQSDVFEEGTKTKKKKRTSSGKLKKTVLFVCSAALFGLVAGAVMLGVDVIGKKALKIEKKDNTQVATVASQEGEVEIISENGVADVAEEVMPSIVSITNKSVQVVRSWFQSYEREVSGSGSGIIIGQDDDNIMIVTNYHVIDGAKELTVSFMDETSVAATVKGYDDSADLAVLTVSTDDIEEDTLKKIKVAALGSSDDLRVGEPAIAIGNALGYGQSLTVGYIGALEREVETDNGSSLKLLQTDAAINPGNSGGALLNFKGQVIGINTMKFVDSTVEGMGYAIPISKAVPIINDLMNQVVIKESEQGYLGIQGKDITEEYAQGFSMPKGVYVVKIIEGSPADTCGLKAGDIITKIGDRDVSSMESVQNILSGKKAGDTIQMTVQRNNEKGEYEEVKLDVKLGAKKDMPKSESDKKTITEDNHSKQDDEQDKYPDDSYDNYDYFEDFFDMMP